MKRLTGFYLLLCSSMVVAQSGESLPESVKDPFYGQVLFDFHQQNYFSAITHLRASQQQRRLPHHIDEAELLLGGLYLSYGMQKHAEQIFNQMLERRSDPVDAESRNRIWLALAGIYYERGYETTADELLGRITGPLPPQQEDERLLLEATLLTHEGRYVEAATRLAASKRDSLERAYAQYNLALEHLRQGREGEGRALLEPLAHLEGNSGPERSALRDKANIALGYSWLRREQFAQAKVWFEQVGLNGPFASQAMLGLGWVESGLGNGAGALSVWLPLTQRTPSDSSVLEGLLAVPYTLNQLGAKQQALEQYKKAINAYDNELKTLEGIISGMNFVALAQELVDTRVNPEAGWQWRVDVKSSSILGPYLYQVMAGHEFQEALRNYRDLLYLDRNLTRWQSDLDAYEAMVDTRQSAYEGRLPQIQAALAKLDSNSLQQQRDQLAERLRRIEAANDFKGLATTKELQQLATLRELAARLKHLEGGINIEDQWHKLAVLKGTLLWQLETQYPSRLWQAKRQLQQLDESLATSSGQRRSLSEALARSPSDFKRYRQTIKAARNQMSEMQQLTRTLTSVYEGRLQQLTVAALQDIQARVKSYQGEALFAAAQIYDSALYAEKERSYEQ